MSARHVDIIAHRGASFEAPENTLAAVRQGWAEDADAVEIDISLTADDRVVVLHDPITARVAARDLRVSETTLEELRRLDVGAWKGEHWRGEVIPTLEEVLATVPADRRLFIELKCGVEIGPALDAVLSSSSLSPEATVLIGQDLETLAEIKRRHPTRAAYLVTARRPGPRASLWHPTIADLIRSVREAGLDGLDLRHRPGVDMAAVEAIHAAGLPLYVWTVNSRRDAIRLVEMGVDGITTDRPGWLRAALPPEAGTGDGSLP